MNISDLKFLQNRVYELEGLIELAINRNLPAQLAALISDKSAEIAEIAAPWKMEADLADEPVGLSGYPTQVDEYEDEDEYFVPDEEYEDEEFTQEIYEQEIYEEAGSDDSAHDAVEADSDAAEDSDAAKVPDADDADDEGFEVDFAYEVSEDAAEESLAPADFVESENVEPEPENEDFENEEPEREKADPESEKIATESENIEPVNRKVEPVVRKRSLESFFSLNDKFRFRRELFGGSLPDFAGSLGLVSSLATLADAEDYFYNDLQWNPDSPEVQAFMTIITQYFNQ